MKRLNQFKRCLLIDSFSLIFTLFLFLAFQQTAWCLESTESNNSQEVRSNKDILKGIDQLYKLQFDDAEILFRNVIAESPDKPCGYFYLAMVTWSRMVAGFWSPDTIREYKGRIDRTIEVAEARIKNDVADSYDFFYLGGALGFLGRFELMRGEWFSSFLAAKKAIKALKTCHKMAPNNRDVLLGLGTFDYYTARLSGVLRFLSYLLLHKGGKEEGLRKLHLAAEEAIYSGSEAKSVLAHIYLFIEWDFPKALHLAKDLGDRYEEDPMYKLFQGVSYIWLGMDHEYRDMVRLLRQRGLEASSKEAASLWSRRALYLESTNDLFHGRYHEARLKLGAILDKSDPENDPLMIAWPIVKIGMSYDLEGNREEAEKHYHQVLNMENGSGAQFMAKRCLKRPISVRDPKIGY